jgi:hypothetical protein
LIDPPAGIADVEGDVFALDQPLLGKPLIQALQIGRGGFRSRQQKAVLAGLLRSPALPAAQNATTRTTARSSGRTVMKPSSAFGRTPALKTNSDFYQSPVLS